MTREEYFMQQAILLSAKGIAANDGGPFGCVIVQGDTIVGLGNNKVTSTNDPTAHAEMVAIREACRVLGEFQLSGCDFYTSCEPCPMCLGALYWARPARVFFVATHEAASSAGFDDSFIYRQIDVPPAERSIPMIHVPHENANRPFDEWATKSDRTKY